MDKPISFFISIMSRRYSQSFRGLIPAAMMPSPEQISNIDLADRSSLQGWIRGVVIAAICLIVFIVSVRLLVRRLMTHHFFLDDCESLISNLSVGSVANKLSLQYSSLSLLYSL